MSDLSALSDTDVRGGDHDKVGPFKTIRFLVFVLLVIGAASCSQKSPSYPSGLQAICVRSRKNGCRRSRTDRQDVWP